MKWPGPSSGIVDLHSSVHKRYQQVIQKSASGGRWWRLDADDGVTQREVFSHGRDESQPNHPREAFSEC